MDRDRPQPPVAPVAPVERVLTVQWDVAGNVAPIRSGDVNQTFTALHVMDRLSDALQAQTPFPSPGEKLVVIRAVLRGEQPPPAPPGQVMSAEDEMKPLTQAQLAKYFIPAVQKKWAALYVAPATAH